MYITQNGIYDSNIIQVVDSFNYLGLTLYYEGKFTKVLKLIALQGKKTMGLVLRLCHKGILNRLFDLKTPLSGCASRCVT